MAPTAASHYPPSVLATATLAAAAGIYFIHSCINRSQAPLHPSGLHRSNAIRRPNNNTTDRRPNGPDLDTTTLTSDPEVLRVLTERNTARTNEASNETVLQNVAESRDLVEAVEVQGDAVTADHAETEQSILSSTDDPAPTESGTRLQQLVYAIAKNSSELEGIVHRGISCDKCHRVPIVGVRYHCVNCPDFDLCEDCEATDCHLKTHVFYKVKVPSPWGGKSPLPVWYPGDPTRMPHTLENGAFKNTLVQKTGFPHNKIDGLYQQFSCMANVKTVKTPGMAIDRAAFDHCFIGQTMTERPVEPNLVHERLFAFYDQNGDGLVDFEEFVVGSSLVHSKDRHKREQRIFRGLDLDGDDFIRRKDCLKMFRAFYNLNKDILLGYMNIEREGENGDLARVSQDPRDHIARGRPLASFFDENPSFLTREPHLAKPKDIDSDTSPLTDGIEMILGRVITDDQDLLTQEEVTERTWLSLWTVFNDDIFRLCAGKPMRWLINDDHVCIWTRPLGSTSNDDLFEDDKGFFWIADSTYFGTTAFVKLLPPDLEKANNGDKDYKHLIKDTLFQETAHHHARRRLCFENIYKSITQFGKEKVRDKAEYSEFMLEDPASHKFPSFRDHSTLHRLDEKLEVIDSDDRQVKANMGILSRTTDGASDITREAIQNFVGGTGAAHTIYNVIEDALNELLDPLFKPSERLALEVSATQEARDSRHDQISTYLDNARRRLAAIIPDLKSLTDLAPSKEARAQAIRDFVSKVSSWTTFQDDEDTLRSAYIAWYSVYMTDSKHLKDQNVQEHFLTWLVELETTKQLETQLKEMKKKRNSQLASDIATASEETSLENEDRTLEDGSDPTLPQHRQEQEPEETSVENDSNDQDKEQITSGKSHIFNGNWKKEDSLLWRLMGDDPLNDNKEDLYLATLEAVARNNKVKGGNGLVDFAEFLRKLELTEENGDKLLQWVGCWIDLVMF